MKNDLGYWIATILFCAALGPGGVAHLLRVEDMAEGMRHLGYPAYVMSILGVAKILGVATLLAPGLPRLKEWAYAGFVFNLGGAVASHVFVGDPIAETLPPAILLTIALVSYALRPASRRIDLASPNPQPA